MEAADAYLFPEWMSFEEAACIAVPFGTAWRMLVVRAKVQAGEDVLVMAAGSGIGSGAIQLCKLLGARVITTASSQWKLDKAAELGADDGINYKEFPEFSRKVRELTGGEGVHVIFEHVGAPVWRECFASLRRGGRFINSGVTAGHRVELHLGQLWTRELTLMGTTMRPREDMPEIMKLVGETQAARRPVRGAAATRGRARPRTDGAERVLRQDRAGAVMSGSLLDRVWHPDREHVIPAKAGIQGETG